MTVLNKDRTLQEQLAGVAWALDVAAAKRKRPILTLPHPKRADEPRAENC